MYSPRANAISLSVMISSFSKLENAVPGQAADCLEGPHRGDRLPSPREPIKVAGASQILSEGPNKAILQFWPERFGHSFKALCRPKAGVPYLFDADDLQAEMPNGESAYLRLHRVGRSNVDNWAQHLLSIGEVHSEPRIRVVAAFIPGPRGVYRKSMHSKYFCWVTSCIDLARDSESLKLWRNATLLRAIVCGLRKC